MELEYLKYILALTELSRYLDQETANLSKGTFSVFKSNCHLLLPVYPLKGTGNPIECLVQKHNKRTCRPIFTLSSFMLNVKQGSREYQHLVSFGLTRSRNRTQIYRHFNTKITKFYCLKEFKRTFQLKT